MARFDDLLVCGSEDALLRFFTISFASAGHFEDGSEVALSYMGTINRTGTDKTTFLLCHQNLLIAHGIRDVIDVWQFNNPEEIRKRIRKRQRKAKRAMKENGEEPVIMPTDDVIIEDRLGKNTNVKSGTILSYIGHLFVIAGSVFKS